MPATCYNRTPLVFTRPAHEFSDRLDVHFNEPRWDKFYDTLNKVVDTYGCLSLDKATNQFNVGLTTAATQFYCESGILFLRGENVYEGGIDLTSVTFVPEERHKEWLSSQIRPGYIVLNLVGNIGDACLVPESIPEAQINRALGRIIPDESKVDARYLVEFLNSDLGKGQFIRYSQGGMQRRFNHPDGMFVKVPTCNQSKLIMDRLDAIRELQRRILQRANEINTKISRLLDTIVEIMAKEIELPSFPKPWFGRLYLKKSDSKIERLDVLGANPEFENACWSSGKFVPLSAVCLVDGTNEQIPLGNQKYISIEGMPGNFWGEIEPVEVEIEEQTGRTHFFNGDIAWAHLKPSILQGKAYLINEECWGSHHFLRIATSGVDEDLRTVIWAYLKTSPIKRHLANKCTGKSESQKDVNDKALGILPFPKLAKEQVKSVAQAALDFVGKSHELAEKEHQLRAKSELLIRMAKSNIFELLDEYRFNKLVEEAREALQ
jgi:hypothetical protein